MAMVQLSDGQETFRTDPRFEYLMKAIHELRFVSFMLFTFVYFVHKLQKFSFLPMVV